MSDLKDLQKRALIIANHYDDYNRVRGRKTWDLNDYVDGMVGDVGDLMKLTMAFRERRDGSDDNYAKVEHELNDVLWSVLVLFYCFKLDLNESFTNAIDELEKRIIRMKTELKEAV